MAKAAVKKKIGNKISAAPDDDSLAVKAILGPKRKRKATGVSDGSLQNTLVRQALGSMSPQQDSIQAIAATLAAMAAIAPKDGIEGMLAAQMVATHEAAMECMGRAALPDQTLEEQDFNLKHAEKLMLVYARQVEALDKRRGKGQQRITVEHVTVKAGGQAIVGNVHSSAEAEKFLSPAPALSDQSQDVTPLPDFLSERPTHLGVRTRRG